ncbi:uncharacterized protein LOC106162540 [Lingula anatina]|uniref:Uncharacterized protein LOC106162540 n=1 Tax=Lingula anatina TaxID=7574 RepID=A0A1S3IBS0_LINAN|nr:uncharacterized protein LOC106162540 [Lingula anatina]|eukprot:XP_013395306.1 uncharacterized protein LOC106162540 [Lingula anatina]
MSDVTLTVLEKDDTRRQELEKVVGEACLGKDYKCPLKVGKVELVENEALQQEFLEKKNEFVVAGRQPEEYEERYGFLGGLGRSAVRKLCKTGLLAEHSLYNTLGYNSQGVYLCQYADICTRWALEKAAPGDKTLRLLVCKYMHGRLTKTGPKAQGANEYSPASPDFDSHFSLFDPDPTQQLRGTFDNSQVYLFEFQPGGGRTTVKRPRHCCPYAIITYTESGEIEDEAAEEENTEESVAKTEGTAAEGVGLLPTPNCPVISQNPVDELQPNQGLLGDRPEGVPGGVSPLMGSLPVLDGPRGLLGDHPSIKMVMPSKNKGQDSENGSSSDKTEGLLGKRPLLPGVPPTNIPALMSQGLLGNSRSSDNKGSLLGDPDPNVLMQANPYLQKILDQLHNKGEDGQDLEEGEGTGEEQDQVERYRRQVEEYRWRQEEYQRQYHQWQWQQYEQYGSYDSSGWGGNGQGWGSGSSSSGGSGKEGKEKGKEKDSSLTSGFSWDFSAVDSMLAGMRERTLGYSSLGGGSRTGDSNNSSNTDSAGGSTGYNNNSSGSNYYSDYYNYYNGGNYGYGGYGNYGDQYHSSGYYDSYYGDMSGYMGGYGGSNDAYGYGDYAEENGSAAKKKKLDNE